MLLLKLRVLGYDRYIYGGDKTALSESAQRGMKLFYGEELECHHCHVGFNFTDSTRQSNSNPAFLSFPFHNTGLYNFDGKGGYPVSSQ